MKEQLNNGTMKALKINQTVFSSQHGEGTVKSIDGMKAVVSFNGVEKTMLTMVLKTAAPKQKVSRKEVEPIINFKSIVNQIKGTSQDRGSMFAFGDVFSKIEKLAFNEILGESELAGEIVEKARNGKFISEKQACVVAYFAKDNGLIKI